MAGLGPEHGARVAMLEQLQERAAQWARQGMPWALAYGFALECHAMAEVELGHRCECAGQCGRELHSARGCRAGNFLQGTWAGERFIAYASGPTHPLALVAVPAEPPDTGQDVVYLCRWCAAALPVPAQPTADKGGSSE